MKVLSKMGIIAVPSLILSISFIAHAQVELKGNKGSGDSGKSGFGRTEGTRSTNSGTKVVIKRVPGPRVIVTPQTGTLYISAEPGASVKLEYLNSNGEVAEESENTIPFGERSIILNDLRPGRYRVVAELNGYKLTSGPREVTVNKGKSDKVDLTLVPITYSVRVRLLNVNNGTLYYAKPGEVSRSVDFQNGQTTLSNLTGGNYTIKIEPQDASYKTWTGTLSVPNAGGEVSYTLEKLSESKDFLGATAGDWDMPSTWSFNSRKVIVNGAGKALPSDNNYRNYRDFQLSTDMRMMNGVAASFVVHAVDSQNYYLIQITGPNSDDPYMLRGYIYRNGSMQRFGRTIPISQFSDTLKPGKFFHVVLTMVGNEISVKVVDSETGDLLKLGTLPDPTNAFAIGAVGIAARDNEQNEVGQFIICSAESLHARKCGD